ncbi:MarR family winged helix-turn-helix transcriptional regulator [Flavobacterium sp. AG291]|uniref:MarR family winged helix-turn-helix transcriptional regulator n=1 Tax=Flavobacterium sp. AG291 TaxID=2184000 RepID=UPI000E09E2C7|nr:winged helix DNA-binding protein [Flavobacterium sp. AG291]RDI14561.1 DNA-binding MarR family transcriptional regulator [Flavobacterium sp. AG291]
MNYTLLKEVIELIEDFEASKASKKHSLNLEGFKEWIADSFLQEGKKYPEPEWENKNYGRTPESAISTMLIHMSRYAKMYSKSAISDSSFSTQEDFIYLINLNAFGAMSKIELIKKNIQDKPTGMQIIGRLIKQGWVIQIDSDNDKRAKVISITEEGKKALDALMGKIRQATSIVSGNLSYLEKMELIRILNKLEDFHNPIFNSNISVPELLDEVNNNYLQIQN